MLYQVLGGLCVLIGIGLTAFFFFKGMMKLEGSTLENVGAMSVDVGSPKSPPPALTSDIQECLETAGKHFALAFEIAADDEFSPMAICEGMESYVITFEADTLEESNQKLELELEKKKPTLKRFFRITEGQLVGNDGRKPDDLIAINIWTKSGHCPEKVYWAFKRVGKGRLSLVGDPLIIMHGGRVDDPQYSAAVLKGMRSNEYGADLLKGRK